ncbi:hypothetical protein LP414_15910 [Polaromonas sp. P1(28)-13]|nr:hypothetical protein LP414_15910 [Polaromonas sp. P1(28)-13]
MHKRFLIGVIGAALGFAGQWAGAQTVQIPPMAPSGAGAQLGQGVQGGKNNASATDQTVPLRNPLNRNPAHRNRVPDTGPAPLDPRDSTTRPALPPDDDGRATVIEPAPTPEPRTRTEPARSSRPAIASPRPGAGGSAR